MLIRQTLLYLPAQIAGPFAQLAAAVVWTHWMSPTLYGDLTFVMAAQDLVFLLCLFWWSSFTVRHVSGEVDAHYRNAEVPVLVVTSIAQALATLLALLFITTPLTPTLALASIVYAVTRSLGLHLGERARAQGRIFTYTVAQTAGPLVGFGFAFVAVSLIEPTPDAALLGYSIAQILALIWLVYDLRLTIGTLRPDKDLIVKALTFGLPLIAAGAAAWVGLNVIRVVVDRFAGGEAMGLIAVGWGLGQRLTATASMFVTVAAFPLAVRSLEDGSQDKALQHLAVNGLLMFGLVLPASVGFILLSGPLVRMFVALPFQDTTLAVLPFAVGAGLARNMRTHVVDQVFILMKATRAVLLINVVEAVAVTAGCGLGLWMAGPVGAVGGCCLGYMVVMVAGFAMAERRVGLRPSYADAAWVTLAAVAMALVLVLPPWQLVPGGPMIHVALQTIIGAMVYGAAIAVAFPAILRGARASAQTLRRRR